MLKRERVLSSGMGHHTCSEVTARGKALTAIASLIAGFLLLECLLPLGHVVQVGADEGFELAKATLCLRGYSLHADVWNDQPPLHTLFVTAILRHTSSSILGPRLLTVGFSITLLASFLLIGLRISDGVRVAILSGAMLVVSGARDKSGG